jgi:transposase
VPSNTLYGWVKKAKLGGVDIGTGERNPEDVLNIAQENQQLKKQIKAMEREIKRLNEMNEFLEDAAAFFAANRQKSGKAKD